MKFYFEVEITKLFEKIDNYKAWLLEIKDKEFLVKPCQDYINNLEKLINDIIIVKE